MDEQEIVIDYVTDKIKAEMKVHASSETLDGIIYEYVDRYDNSELREVFPDAFKGK